MGETWPAGWRADLSDELRRSLEAELSRELPPGHVLFGRPARAVAIGKHPDDVAVQLDRGQYATVHLTWQVESDARWPSSQVFDDFNALVRYDDDWP